jgi:hypothetical protein
VSEVSEESANAPVLRRLARADQRAGKGGKTNRQGTVGGQSVRGWNRRGWEGKVLEQHEQIWNVALQSYRDEMARDPELADPGDLLSSSTSHSVSRC